jgi:hypothetical protein
MKNKIHPQFSLGRMLLVVAAGVLLPTTSVKAATLSHDVSVPVQKTNFKTSINIPKFNPELGTLDSVKLLLGGEVQGSIRLESEDAAPAYITADLAAEVSLLRPDNTILLTTLPKASVSANLSTYDGITDFSGTSGKKIEGLSDRKIESTTLTNNFGLFIGSGNINLPVLAAAKSSGSGAGNLVQGFNTNAGANVQVIYNYTLRQPPLPPRKVPESEIPLLSLVGFGTLMVIMKKNDKKSYL